MKRSFFAGTLTAFMIAVLLLGNMPPTAYALQTTIYSTNFNSGYADWTATSATGGISLTTSPVISGSAVYILNSGHITRTVSTVGYSSRKYGQV